MLRHEFDTIMRDHYMQANVGVMRLIVNEVRLVNALTVKLSMFNCG